MDNINIKVHEDMGDVKERFYGFTARQWIFAIITGVIVVPLYIYGRDVIGEDLAQILVILIGGPILFVGFVPVQGLKAEKIIPYWWRNYMAFHIPLEYKTEAELAAEKASGQKKKKKKVSKKKKKKDIAVQTSKNYIPDSKEYFDIFITSEIIRSEDSVSYLIRVPNSNGQYIYVQKAKLLRMGEETLLYRIQKGEDIFTYDKDGVYVGETDYDSLKANFR